MIFKSIYRLNMNNEKYSKRHRCTICSRLCKLLFRMNKDKKIIFLAFNNENLCERYLFNFLIELQDKLNEQNKIDEHFINSIFDDDDQINQTSCDGLTLMHVNILGGE